MTADQPVSRRALLAGGLAGVGALAAACTGSATRRDQGTARLPASDPTARPGATGTPRVGTPRLGTPTGGTTSPGSTSGLAPHPSPASAAQIAARATVPVLCYHQLRNWRPSDGAYARELLICPPATFRAHLDALSQDGWTTISPDQYLAHLTSGRRLPAKPVMLSFDDSQGSQITEGLPQLRRRQMTGTFFVMTVVLGKRDWMSERDLRSLTEAGMTVAAHTWDHHRVDRYGPTDWSVQLEQPRALLRRITGTEVNHFAYPYGAWKPAVVPHVRAAGYQMAFQLEDQPLDPQVPLFTLRRILTSSRWSGEQLLARLRRT